MKLLAEEINALPERVRSFVHDLETRADPAGDVRRAFVAEENACALNYEVEKLRAENSRLYSQAVALLHFVPRETKVGDIHEIRAKYDQWLKAQEFPA